MPTSNKITYIKNGQPVSTDAYPLNKMVTWPGIKKYHEMLAYEIPRLGSNNRIGAIALYSFSLGQSNMVTGASVASFALGSGNTVTGSYSLIAGYGNTITGSSVTAFGRNLTLDATQNNERPLLMIGDGLNISDEAWKGKQVAFAIGGKEKDKDAKNLIIVTYDGKTVINGDLTVTGTLSNTGDGTTIEGKASRSRNWLIGMKSAYLTNNDMGQHALWSIANEGLTKDDKSLDNHLLINYNHPDLTQAPKVIAFHRGPDEYADIYCKDCECAGLVGIKSGVIYSGKKVIQFRTSPASDAGYSDLYCKDVECSGVIGTEKGIIYNSNGTITFQTSPGNTTPIGIVCKSVKAGGNKITLTSEGKIETTAAGEAISALSGYVKAKRYQHTTTADLISSAKQVHLEGEKVEVKLKDYPSIEPGIWELVLDANGSHLDAQSDEIAFIYVENKPEIRLLFYVAPVTTSKKTTIFSSTVLLPHRSASSHLLGMNLELEVRGTALYAVLTSLGTHEFPAGYTSKSNSYFTIAVRFQSLHRVSYL